MTPRISRTGQLQVQIAKERSSALDYFIGSMLFSPRHAEPWECVGDSLQSSVSLESISATKDEAIDSLHRLFKKAGVEPGKVTILIDERPGAPLLFTVQLPSAQVNMDSFRKAYADALRHAGGGNMRGGM